jgi:hypothetical protein
MVFALTKNGIIVTLCHTRTGLNLGSLLNFELKRTNFKGSVCGIEVAENKSLVKIAGIELRLHIKALKISDQRKIHKRGGFSDEESLLRVDSGVHRVGIICINYP